VDVSVLSTSVVVCTHADRREPAVHEAVRSLRAQIHPPDEVIVVVDHRPQLAERLRGDLGDACVLDSCGRPGLSGARNTGVAAAGGEVVAFLDDDAIARPDWLARLVDCYADPGVAAAGGRVEPIWPEARPRWLPDEFLWVVGCSWRGLPAAPTPVRNLIGANMSFRREALAHAGGFEEGIGRIGNVPLGCEETELCIRLRRLRPDAVVLYDPRARVGHRLEADRLRLRYFMRRCWAEGLSKALVSAAHGADAALSAERAHVLRTLPTGVGRELARAVRGDLAGLGRAAVIPAGLAVTAAGYLAGRCRVG
jgi:GT2 family glycosyltransferase